MILDNVEVRGAQLSLQCIAAASATLSLA